MAQKKAELRLQKKALSSLRQEQLYCQQLHTHPFIGDELQPDDIRPTWSIGRARAVAYKCVCCGTRRIDVVDSTGDVAWRDYQYPEWWQHFTSENRPGIKALRLERLNRLTKES